MSELENKLNTLLADPEAMAQVMNLAQSLQGQLGGDGGAPPPVEKTTPPSAPLADLLGGIDPALLTRLLPVVQQLKRRESSETAALLYALRPFLRAERQEKVERAVQLARLFHLAKVFFTKGGLDV